MHVTRVAELQPFHDNSQTPCRESTWRAPRSPRDVILRLRWGSAYYLDGWVLKNIFLVNRWRKICYVILTLLGVCHETGNFFCPVRKIKA